METLVLIAKNSNALDILGSGLHNLNSIDDIKTAQVYKLLELNKLIEIAKSSKTIYILGNGLSNLKLKI